MYKIEPNLLLKLQSTKEEFNIKNIENYFFKDIPVYLLPKQHEYASINYFEEVKELIKPENTNLSEDEFEEKVKGKYPIKVGTLKNVIVEGGYISYWIDIDPRWKHKFGEDNMVIFAYAENVEHNIELDLIQYAVYITPDKTDVSLYTDDVINNK